MWFIKQFLFGILVICLIPVYLLYLCFGLIIFILQLLMITEPPRQNDFIGLNLIFNNPIKYIKKLHENYFS